MMNVILLVIFFIFSFTKYICTQNLGDTNIIARDHQNSKDRI